MSANERTYLLSISRLDVCKISMAITSLIIDMRRELNDPECNEYRKEHVLPQSIEMWQKLHDKVNDQLDRQDRLQDWYTE